MFVTHGSLAVLVGEAGPEAVLHLKCSNVKFLKVSRKCASLTL
jgi:hypothetical protein